MEIVKTTREKKKMNSLSCNRTVKKLDQKTISGLQTGGRVGAKNKSNTKIDKEGKGIHTL